MEAPFEPFLPATARWPFPSAAAAAAVQLNLSRHNRDLRPCLKQKTFLRTALLYPGDGLGPGQNETTQARMKIPRPAQMATVGSQVVGGT